MTADDRILVGASSDPAPLLDREAVLTAIRNCNIQYAPPNCSGALQWQIENARRDIEATILSLSTKPLVGEGVQGRIGTKQPTDPEVSSRTETTCREGLRAMEDECWTVRCVDIPTGAGDADIGWEVIEHHMTPPKDRVIGFGSSPLRAIQDALSTEAERRHG